MSLIKEALFVTHQTVKRLQQDAEQMRDGCKCEDVYQFYDGQATAYGMVCAMLLKVLTGDEETESEEKDNGQT